MMHGHEKSGDAIVAEKPTNKAERSAAEPVERRAKAKGNAGQQSTHRAQYRVSVAQALACIRRIIAVDTRGGSRMRESCTYGSVRGALSNERPYRDRREFITLLGGSMAAWPLPLRAQQGDRVQRIPKVGILNYAEAHDVRVRQFLGALRELGYVEGTNLTVTHRWADGVLDRLPELAAELVASRVDAIIALAPAVWAAKRT